MKAPTTAGRTARRTTSRTTRGRLGRAQGARRCAPIANGCRSPTMPGRDYEIGDLATLFRPETRLTGAQPPARLCGGAARPERPGGGAGRGSATGRGSDPARTLMGGEQEAWLAGALRRSIGARRALAGARPAGGHGRAGDAAGGGGLARPGDSDARRGFYRNLIDAGQAGLPFGLDGWDGYPAARRRLLRSALDADANLVVLSGDSHNAWALRSRSGRPRRRASSSPGTASPRPAMRASCPRSRPQTVAARRRRPQPAAQMGRHQPARLCDASTLTPERATGEWLFLDTIRQRSTRLAGRHGMSVRAGATASPRR